MLIYLSVQYSYTSPYSTYIPLFIHYSWYFSVQTSSIPNLQYSYLYVQYSYTSPYSTHTPLRTVLIYLSVQYSYTSQYSTHIPLLTVLIYLSSCTPYPNQSKPNQEILFVFTLKQFLTNQRILYFPLVQTWKSTLLLHWFNSSNLQSNLVIKVFNSQLST